MLPNLEVQTIMENDKFNARQQAFLNALAITGSISKSAEAAGVNRNQHRAWAKESPEFAEALVEAREVWADSLEAEAVRRAVEGTLDPIVQNGKQVIGPDGKPLFRNNKSDYLLSLLLKGHRPERYNPPVQTQAIQQTMVASVNKPPGSISDLSPEQRLTKAIEIAKTLQKLGLLEKPPETT